MYRSAYSRDMFAELDRLQRAMQEAFDVPSDLFSPSIRGTARSGFPALNVGSTPQSVEIYAFVPGVAPDSLDVQIEKGLLTIAGERKPQTGGEEKSAKHIEERFTGKFRRVVSLPDDIDPEAVTAHCRDGVLHVSIKRRASVLPRRINVQ